MQKKAWPAVALAVVAGSWALTGCGSSKSSTSSGTGADTGAAPVKLNGSVNSHGSKDLSGKSTASLGVEADDFYFSPTFLKATPGEKITVELHNEGKATHTFTTSDGSVDQTLAPDSKATVTVTAPSSGVLTYYCRFHQSRGMQGGVYLHDGDTAGPMSSSGSGSGSGSGSTTSSTSSGGSGY
jgi:plastocyanin